MRAVRPFSTVNHGLALLVWLALLLPLAHSAAIWHGYSHFAPAAAGYEDDQGAPAAAHCGLCLAAAGVTGGALPAGAVGLSLSAARHAVPPAADPLGPVHPHLQTVLSTLKATPARMVLYAAYQDSRPSEWLSRNASIPAVKIPLTVGGSDGAKDLFGLFDDTLARLLAAGAAR